MRLANSLIRRTTQNGVFKSARFYSASSNLASTSTSGPKFGVQTDLAELKTTYDVIIVGGGHNGLVSAAYLQKAGYSVCVLERRHILGGAAVTEEIIPGFKFSRASYVLSLLRPFIISDLKLKEHGLKVYMREPYNSYTPIKESLWHQFNSKSLLLSSNPELSFNEIAKFSKKDAEIYKDYEHQMGKFVNAVTQLIDNRPPNLWDKNGSFSMKRLKALKPALKAIRAIGTDLPEFHQVMTTSAAKILDRWFESEPLKATLATDALVGTMSGPYTEGTGYVLLHHIMGGVNGVPGAWAYAEGGMGGVSQAIASSASKMGVHLFTGMNVSKILLEKVSGTTRAVGVITKDGQEVRATKAIFSGTTPAVTFNKLLNCKNNSLSREVLGEDFIKSIDAIDYTSPVTKINVALNRIPNFAANPNPNGSNEVQDWHKTTIHINSETMKDLGDSFDSCNKNNVPSERPMIEMVIPSSIDPTLCAKGSHVCLLFTQFTPYSPSDGSWTDPNYKEKYANRVFDVIEEYAPGFKSSVVGKEVLTPWDLEQTFGLTGGNIFHGAISIDQLFWLRPIFTKKCWFPETPIAGLYLCGSGVHPGGGVMGAPGYLAAQAFMNK